RARFFFQAEDGIRDFHVTGVQTCALPISRTVPETKLASDVEARKTNAGATSAGCPARPSGVSCPNFSIFSSGWVAGCSGVQIGPGATAFTRMPRGPSSAARLTVRLLIAAFVAA